MATKYVSALNGQQMDAALTDMAYHTSEAFAIGERNGVPVSSGDVAYHNNAKYYAEQASADATEADAAAARAEAAVPPSTAGAVFFDRAQALTDAQKGQAKANIGAGSTNPNLLDNAYFVGGGSQLGDGVFPINQRGLTSYSGQYGIDRWLVSDPAISMTLQSNGLRVQASTMYVGLVQRLPAYKLQNGEVYTFSIIVDGNLHTATFTANNDGNWQNVYYGDNDWYVPYIFTNGVWNFRVLNSRAQTMDRVISAVKIEKGTVSTLANDVPPDFGEELRKCQRYLFIRDYAQNDVIANGLTNNLTMFLPVSMRSGGSPTMTFTVTPYVIGNGVISTPTSVNLASVNGNQVQIYAPTTESHNAQTIVLYAGSATRMTIANEL